MNVTQNIQLNQWDKTDRILMEDFNADNAKTDAALGELTAALTAETAARNQAVSAETAARTAALALKGNCQLYTMTYTGNGVCGQDTPTSVTFPEPPALVLVAGSTGLHCTMHRGRRSPM